MSSHRIIKQLLRFTRLTVPVVRQTKSLDEMGCKPLLYPRLFSTVVKRSDEVNSHNAKDHVYCGNLHPDLTDKKLKAFFKDNGIHDVNNVTIVRDMETGLSRGYGFINFSD